MLSLSAAERIVWIFPARPMRFIGMNWIWCIWKFLSTSGQAPGSMPWLFYPAPYQHLLKLQISAHASIYRCLFMTNPNIQDVHAAAHGSGQLYCGARPIYL